MLRIRITENKMFTKLLVDHYCVHGNKNVIH